MSVLFKRHARSLHATLEGEIDHHRARGLLREIRQQVDCDLPEELILDCAGVQFMDSAGIACILRLYQQMKQTGGQLLLVDVPPQAARVLHAAHLHRILPFD